MPAGSGQLRLAGGVAEQRGDRAVDEAVPDDPAIALGGDGAAGAQMPQSLGDGGIGDPGGGRKVGDADRAGRMDAGEHGQPGGIGQQGELSRAGPQRGGVADGLDGLADALAVDDALAVTLGRQEMHADSLP